MDKDRKAVMEWISRNVREEVIAEWKGNKAILVNENTGEITLVEKRGRMIIGVCVLDVLED